MGREAGEILEELAEAQKYLLDQEAEVCQAEMHYDSAKSEVEDLKHELETTDYDEFKNWEEKQKS